MTLAEPLIVTGCWGSGFQCFPQGSLQASMLHARSEYRRKMPAGLASDFTRTQAQGSPGRLSSLPKRHMSQRQAELL